MKQLLSLAWLLIIANEVRGLIMAAPVFYGLYLTGGTLMAAWLAFCSLAGIAASVFIPMWAVRKLEKRHGKKELQRLA